MRLLVLSLMKINTTLLDTAGVSASDTTVTMIVKQNKMAKTQSVSSFQWASALLSLASGDADFDFNKLMIAYNQHPDVVSSSNDSAGGTGGVGSIALTGRMKCGVKRWLDETCEKAWGVVSSSTHDVPFLLGPFGG